MEPAHPPGSDHPAPPHGAGPRTWMESGRVRGVLWVLWVFTLLLPGVNADDVEPKSWLPKWLEWPIIPVTTREDAEIIALHAHHTQMFFLFCAFMWSILWCTCHCFGDQIRAQRRRWKLA